MHIRRSLILCGAAAAGGVLVFAGFIFWHPPIPARPRHPNSNNPHQLLNEAEYLFWLNNPIEARPLYARAEQLFEAEGDGRNAFYARISQIPAEMESRNLADLSDYLAKELRRPGIDKDPYLRLRLLVVKGEVDLNLDGLSSRPVWQEVESLASSLGEKQLASRASGELGILAYLAGNGSEAKWRVGKALVYARIFNDVGAQIRYLSMIGQGYADVGRSEEALKYLDPALEKAARNPDAGFPRLATIGKISALTTAGRYTEARALLDRAMAFAKAKALTGYEVDVLAQYGVIAAKSGDTNGAIRFYEQAAELASRIHFLRATAEVESKLAELYEKLGNLNRAEACAEASAVAQRALGETYAVPHHLAIQANLLAEMGKLREAELLFAKAADVTEAMLLNAQSATARRTVIAAMSEVYVGYFSLAADRLKNLEKAFQIIEEARGRIAADARRIHVHESGSAALRPSPGELRIASLNSRLLDANDPAERARIMDAIFQAEQDLTPDHEPPVRGEPVPLRALQRDLGPDEVLLEYVLTEPQSYCLVITRSEATLAKLVGAQEIRKLVVDYRNSISQRDVHHKQSGRLASALLTPIAQYTTSREVVVVPDGVLNLIPFEALWSESEGYGLTHHSFTVVPSGTVLHLLRNDQAKPTPIAFLGVSASDAGTSKKKSGLGIFRELLDMKRSDLAALPSTETEVKSIAKLIGTSSTLLMRDQATEAAFKSEPLREMRVIHLAVHGLADSAFPDRSALVFSAGGRSGEDGLLQAREIRKLPINAELVTLSACDAGIGRIEGEEGVSSLVAAFLNAGARTVVASLWPAEDTYTKGLMEAFYRHLAQGETKKEALRQAKMDMLREFGDAVPPLYWAGFVLVGDGNGKIALGGGA
jgi:CHAT domain-containing protein